MHKEIELRENGQIKVRMKIEKSEEEDETKKTRLAGSHGYHGGAAALSPRSRGLHQGSLSQLYATCISSSTAQDTRPP